MQNQRTYSRKTQWRSVASRALGHDGVVCGHIHRAEMRDIDGILYCNDGDWVESRSALVEHLDGRLELVYWNAEQTGSALVHVQQEVPV